jgi:alpha-amylase
VWTCPVPPPSAPPSDAVLNHKLGADEKETFLATMVDENNRTQDIGEQHDITAWTKYTFPGRGDEYSRFKWDFTKFTGVDWDEGSKTKAIFRIQGDGKQWANNVDKESELGRWSVVGPVALSEP